MNEPEHISKAIDKTMDHIRHNMARRVVVKKAKLPATPSAVGHVTPLSEWSPAAVELVADRTKRRPVRDQLQKKLPALVPVTLRIASELPMPVASFRHNGATFLSRDMIVWRATTQYDRLVQRITAAEPVGHLAVFKSLTSPTVLPRNVTLIKPPGFSLGAPKPTTEKPKE